jgi:hypothetical protein
MPSVPPAGTSPASAFTVLEYPAQLPPAAILADAIDPATGELESVFRGRGLADAMMIEAMRIHRGSGAAVRDVGNRFHEVRYVDGTTGEVMASLAREAARPAEEAGVAKFLRVASEPDPDDPSQLNTFIEYRDLLAPADAPTRRLVFRR